MGAVDVSRDGGFLHRSVFGGAAMVNEPIHSGTTSLGMFNGVKEELAGGMASNRNRWMLALRYSVINARNLLFLKLRDRLAYM